MKKVMVLLILSCLMFSILTSSVTGLSESTEKSTSIESNKIKNFYLANPDYYTHYYTQRYAVIVIGEYQTDQHYIWFLQAAQAMYDVLTSEIYGFSNEEIFVLLTLIEDWAEPDGFDQAIIDYEATEENIQNVLNTFKKDQQNEIPSDGLFFFTFIDHGNNDVFSLEGSDSIEAKELKSYMEGINGRNILVLQPCMSGSFVDNLALPGRVVCTSVGPITMEGGWIESFTRGLDGITQDSNPNGNIDSRPKDNRISLEEAFFQAASHVRNDGIFGKYSRLDDNADGTGTGPYWDNSEGYDIDDLTKDGYKASRIFYLTYEEFPLDSKIEFKGDKKTIDFMGHAIGGSLTYLWHWDFGDGAESNEQNPKHNYERDGTYAVTLTVSDSNGYTDEATISLELPLSDEEGKLTQRMILFTFLQKISMKNTILKQMLNRFLNQ